MRSTISVRLTREQRLQLGRACRIHRLSQSGYLTRLAIEQTRKDLLDHAVERYRAGQASLSELARDTGLDVPTIMDALAEKTAAGKEAYKAFLAEARALAGRLKDPEFYEMAKAAVSASPGP